MRKCLYFVVKCLNSLIQDYMYMYMYSMYLNYIISKEGSHSIICLTVILYVIVTVLYY